MELLFYHLEQAPLEKVLPELLAKSLEKGWRAVVETAAVERMEAIDTMLWTFSEESFLPHSTVALVSGDKGNGISQLILITDQPDNPNKADIRFFIDAGDVTAHEGYERLVYIFDGNDEEAVARARVQWKAATTVDEIEATYWQQSSTGRWEKKG